MAKLMHCQNSHPYIIVVIYLLRQHMDLNNRWPRR